MSAINKIALAMAVSTLLISNVSLAAVPGDMQSAANAEAHNISVAVNVKKVTIHCKQATLRIASAAKAKGGKLKGAVLRSAIMRTTSIAAQNYGIEHGCVSPAYVSKAASRLTGIYSPNGPTLGLAKSGGVRGASGGVGGLGILAGVVGIAAIAAIAGSNDDDCVSSSSSC